MDIAAIVGAVVGIFVLFQAHGGHHSAICDLTALLVPLAGGLAATFVAFPIRQAGNILHLMWKALVPFHLCPSSLLERVVTLAERARRGGILSLERAINEDDDDFLAGGVRLAVDGTEPDLIMDILETELQFIEARHALGARVLKTLGRNWALFGGVGALLVLAVNATPEAGVELVGRAAAPLLHGAVLAGLVALPLARKLATYSDREILVKRMIIEGVMSIQQGDNPRVVEHKLSVFMTPAQRPSGPEDTASKPEPMWMEGETAADPTTAAPVPPPPPDSEELVRYLGENEELIIQSVRDAAKEASPDSEQLAAVERLVGAAVRKEIPLVSLLASVSSEVLRNVQDALKAPTVPAITTPEAEPNPFGFDDIVKLTDAEIQTLLREVDQHDLVIAMLGASSDWRERILSGMSERVATYIRDELRYLRKIHPAEVLGTQARLVAQVRQLARQGSVTLPA